MPGSRRDFLRSMWKVGGLLLGFAAGWTTFEALRPLASGAAGGPIKVGSASKFASGSATYFPQGRMYVVNAKNQYFALSQRCPHLGCKVPFCESSGRFECACHGSVFDIGGEWISGPSPRGLDRFALAVEEGELVADTGSLTEGPDRGAEDFLELPRGPSCIEEG